MKIAVLASGGVDSSVALRLLKDQGHDLTAFYIKIWLEDELAFLGDCPWEEDLDYVRQVCKEAGVPLEVVSMQKEYWDEVVDYTIAEVQAGRTPNPDMLCNQRIKFGLFFNHIDESFDKVATGHYARTEERDGKTYLLRNQDPIKDQTYFLGYLSQQQVARALFPLGEFTKEEVRELAQKYDLPNKDRKDSQGICFLGKIRFKEFVKHHLGEKTGDIIELETGKKLGEHPGAYYYTIGQRRGLLLPDGPWNVVKKDLEKNIVYISHRFSEVDTMRDSFEVAECKWILEEPPKKKKLQVKIRHAPIIFDCELELEGKGKTKGKCKMDRGDMGVAAGQFAVFYDGEVCLGGGVIQ